LLTKNQQVLHYLHNWIAAMFIESQTFKLPLKVLKSLLLTVQKTRKDLCQNPLF